jgi:hypothetical protein
MASWNPAHCSFAAVSSSAHDEASVTQTCRESIRFDFDPPWEEIGCQTDDIGALAQRKLRSDAAYQCLAWTHFIFCGVLHFLSSNELLPHTIFHTALSHTTFHSQLSHTRSFTHHL